MDPLSLGVAFVLGFGVRLIGLPPLVGFLAAGFALGAFGVESGPMLERLGDVGVTLLLFSIGLKLDLRSLIKPEVWAGATLHMGITVAVLGAVVFVFGALGLSAFAGVTLEVALLLGFALSFSSTVFAVKVLEAKGEMASFHGRVAIGILIMQDIFAVIFIAVSSGQIPSPWALALLAALILGRPLLYRVIDHTPHGELLMLLAVLLALGVGYSGFESVRLKGDLGALVVGVLVAGHRKSPELARTLLGFKDLFLIGFFLFIGLDCTPTWEGVGIAALLSVLVIGKSALFFLLLPRFKLRARTAFLASLSLSNYSEFGLLVAAIGARAGWIGTEWVMILAIAVSITFIAASPLNSEAHPLYNRFSAFLRRFERPCRHPDDQPLDAGEAEVMVLGMGRVGAGAYDEVRKRRGDRVIGFDFDPDEVARHQEAGRNVLFGDPTDADFWERVRPLDRIRVVMLSLANLNENLEVTRRLHAAGYKGRITAVAKYPEGIAKLEGEGVDAAFNIYASAGAGFADHAATLIEANEEQEASPG